jgi:DNA-binding transcriptional regulator YdaS (Cro superfamily)
MSDDSVPRRSLQRAVEIAGSAGALASTLGVPEPAVQMWLSGRPIPPDIFLRVVDVIIQHDIDGQTNAAASHQRKEA